MTRIFGEKPRPWILVFGIKQDDVLATEITKIAQTVYFLSNEDIHLQVHQLDYDAIIIFGNPPLGLERRLWVLQFGGTGLHEILGPNNGEFYLQVNDRGVGARLTVADNLPERIRNLAEKLLAPWLVDISPREILIPIRAGTNIFITDDIATVRPIVCEVDGRLCAASWERTWREASSDCGEWW